MGKQNFPKIFVAACITLGKPYTNAYLERSFSITTWLDSFLRQNQHNITLEMRLIEKINRPYIEKIKKLYYEFIKKGKISEADVKSAEKIAEDKMLR